MTLAPPSRSWFSVGSDARIRPSSVMVSPTSGTLRSQRISTRLPVRSPRSETDFTLDPSGIDHVVGRELRPYPAGPRCTRHACHAQHRYPTLRGIPAVDLGLRGTGRPS